MFGQIVSLDHNTLCDRKEKAGLYITEMKTTVSWEVTTCILTDEYVVLDVTITSIYSLQMKTNLILLKVHGCSYSCPLRWWLQWYQLSERTPCI